MDIPDVNDPDVRRMVEMDHEPYEWWNLGGKMVVPIFCKKCHNKWPCETIRAFRQWYKDHPHGDYST